MTLAGLFPFTRRITHRSVLWGLALGFTLVVTLLGVASLVAVKEARAIRDSADSLVHEQMLIARLLQDVQAEENALTELLHRLARSPQQLDRAELMRELDRTDEALTRLVADAQYTPEAGVWQDLRASAKRFTAKVREVFGKEQALSDASLNELFAIHDHVVGLSHSLLGSSTRHLTVADEAIELQSSALAGESALLLGACFLLAGCCAIATLIFAQRSIRRIEWQADELNRVSWHMLQTQEATARRFSHELHDELGQSLAAVRASLVNTVVEDAAARRADSVKLVDEAIANVRELSQLLRPVILDDFGLDAGLRWLTEGFGVRTRIHTDYRCAYEERLPSDVETHLFRIAQEALTNIARHSGASRVSLSLTCESDHIVLTIEDNGRGLQAQPHEARRSLGLTGMRARARQCGGTLILETPAPQGLRVRVTIPKTPAAELTETSW